jgi:hypothetical protein
MPGDGLTHGPMRKKAWGRNHRGSAGSSGIPRAMALTVSFVLSPGTCPGDRAFLPPSSREASSSTQLDTSVGVPGPHDFAVRTSHVRPT